MTEAFLTLSSLILAMAWRKSPLPQKAALSVIRVEVKTQNRTTYLNVDKHSSFSYVEICTDSHNYCNVISVSGVVRRDIGGRGVGNEGISSCCGALRKLAFSAKVLL